MDTLAKLAAKTEPIENVKVEPTEVTDTKTDPLNEKGSGGSSSRTGLRNVASEPSISKTFNVGSPKTVIKQEKDQDEKQITQNAEMSEEDRIVLGFKSADNKEDNKTTVTSVSTPAALSLIKNEASVKTLTAAKSDPRLTPRGGAVTPDSGKESEKGKEKSGQDGTQDEKESQMDTEASATEAQS